MLSILHLRALWQMREKEQAKEAGELAACSEGEADFDEFGVEKRELTILEKRCVVNEL